MKKIKFSIAIILSIAFFSITATGVFASAYGQETCTGAYGQTTDCGTVKGSSTSGTVIYRDNIELANTALDTPTLLVAMATISSGIGAFLLKKKIS